jgi:TrkA domain protein
MEIRETQLPGIGIRYEYQTRWGDVIGVLVHRTGRREILRYSRQDPDAAEILLALEADEARTLAELLGATQISEHISAMQHIEGLTIDWVKVPVDSPTVGRTLADLAVHSRTGVSVVAFVDEQGTRAAPGAEDAVQAGSTMVVAGEVDGLAKLRTLLRDGRL